MKTCPVCSDEFVPNRTERVVCRKPECKKSHYRGLIKKWEAKNKERMTQHRREYAAAHRRLCSRCKCELAAEGGGVPVDVQSVE